MNAHRPSATSARSAASLNKKAAGRWLAHGLAQGLALSAAAAFAGLWRGAAGAALVIGGALAYRFFRQQYLSNGGRLWLNTVQRRRAIIALFAALGALARSTGRVGEADIDAASHWLSANVTDRKTRNAAIDAHEQGRAGGAALAALLAPFARDAQSAPALYRPWLKQLIALRRQARHNARWSPAELAALRSIAATIGADSLLLETLLVGGDAELATACAVLGVAPDADAAAIKQAYRKLMARHHPDRLTGAGAEALATAERRTREIRAAYDRLRLSKGF